VHLCNLTAPTETNVCTWYRVPPALPEDARAIPIGQVCDHLEGVALDDAGQEAEEGTLWIKGPNLLAGYWGDAAKTRAALQPDPRGSAGLAYCTGDRVRLRPDGGYDFFGRRDHQIKCRGFRIELGEIESVVAAHPHVLEAVAWAVPDPKLGHRIALTVVPRAGGSLEENRVRNVCAERLPNYMVPEVIEIRGELPRTSTGKVDRNRLRAEWEAREKP
jgi:acyl-CoA synthetase (AMP-forming)/AMP-acid ligase II